MEVCTDLEHPTFECCGELYPFKFHDTYCSICGELFDWEYLLEFWNLEDYEEYLEDYLENKEELDSDNPSSMYKDEYEELFSKSVWNPRDDKKDQLSMFDNVWRSTTDKRQYVSKEAERIDLFLEDLPEGII